MMKKISRIIIISIIVAIIIGAFCSVRADVARDPLQDKFLSKKPTTNPSKNPNVEKEEKIKKMVGLGVGAVVISGTLIFFLTRKEETNGEVKKEEPIESKVD